jgi:hypothetical protein
VVTSTFGGRIGGGFDLHMAHSFAIGFEAGYNWMADFDTPVGGLRNLNGAQAGVSFGWL